MSIVAIDMDGTLLNSNGKISAANAEALKKLKHNGYKVVIATGRDVDEVKRLTGNANVQPDGIVSINGAVVEWQDKILREATMQTKDAADLLEWLENKGYYYHAYTQEGIHASAQGKEFYENDIKEFTKNKEDAEVISERIRQKADEQIKDLVIKDMPSPEELKSNHYKVYKFLVVSLLEEKLHQARKVWSGREEISITSSGRDNIEIMHPDIQKGKGLLSVLEHLHIDAENSFAIGDNYNDLPMFNLVGTSIAMGNAEDDVKKVATHETAHHDEDGVAQAVYDIILK